jgi:nitrate reductase gamma subunit
MCVSAALALFTYFAYIFIVVAYTVKVVKYLKLPVHLRWELYPVIHEDNFSYGGSRLERVNWWESAPRKRPIKGFFYLTKEYFHLGEYFHRHRSYWFALYPWHVGFILIITFHILCFFGAVIMVGGTEVSAASTALTGRLVYWVIMVTGVVSFITGAFGSMGLLFKRARDQDLRLYATPLNYFAYFFTFAVFVSGLFSWLFVDPSFGEYREFWAGLVTLRFIKVESGTAVHIVLFNFFLFYLPFTRSLHYITRFFAFYCIRWDDAPNIRGGELEGRLKKAMEGRLTWSAPHINTGKNWGDQVGDK